MSEDARAGRAGGGAAAPPARAAAPTSRAEAPPPSLHALTVPRTARYATLGGEGPDVREVWICCHGYAQLAADFVKGMAAVASPERLLVAPEALSRFYVEGEVGPHGPHSRVGATWMTREDRLSEIDDYVRYLDVVLAHITQGMAGGAAARRVALGYSQGTQTVARWVARTDAALDELVLWAGRLPDDVDPAALAGRNPRLRVTLAAGTRDRWMGEEAAREEAARLEAAGVPARVVVFEGGHRLDDGALRAVAGAAEAPGAA